MCLAAYIGFICVVTLSCAAKPSNSHKHFSIIGGNETSISSYPYQLPNRYASSPPRRRSIGAPGVQTCSGTLNAVLDYTPVHVANFPLRALQYIETTRRNLEFMGHALDNAESTRPCDTTVYIAYLYRYLTGEVGVRANSSSPLQGGNVFKVKKAHTHPLFSYTTMDYDIALIEVENKFTFNKHFNKIKLAQREPREHMKATVSGWGANATTGFQTDIIKSIQVIVKNKTVCQAEYNSRNFTSRMFCAESTDYGPCWKDDGDPLVAHNQLYGILSRNRGCFEKKYSSVFTKVSVVRQWIYRTIRPKRPKKHRKSGKKHIKCFKK